MPSPFPGMDPYLQDPAFWRDFHGEFICACRELLLDKLALPYDAAVAETGTARRIEVRHPPGCSIVTVIEVLSPAARTVAGVRAHRAERLALWGSGINHVALDLLAGGQRLESVEGLTPAHYFAFGSRAKGQRAVEVYPWSLRTTFPTLPVPLLPGDADVPLALNAAFDAAYDRGGYATRLRYSAAPPASFSAEDQQWARQVARQAIRGGDE